MMIRSFEGLEALRLCSTAKCDATTVPASEGLSGIVLTLEKAEAAGRVYN